MKFFSIVFILTTTLVLLFKREKSNDSSASPKTVSKKYKRLNNAMKTNKRPKIDENNLTIREAYLLLLKIFRLPMVLKLAFVLVTYKVYKLFFFFFE